MCSNSAQNQMINMKDNRRFFVELIKNANSIFYWSRCPGKFVYRTTGEIVENTSEFNGNVTDWYETILECFKDSSAQICHSSGDNKIRANFLVISPEIESIIECTSGYKIINPDITASVPFVRKGNIAQTLDVYISQSLDKDMIIVGHSENASPITHENEFIFPQYYGLIFVKDLR